VSRAGADVVGSLLREQCRIMGVPWGAAPPAPAVLGGPQLVGMENVYVLYMYITETCKIKAPAASAAAAAAATEIYSNL